MPLVGTKFKKSLIFKNFSVVSFTCPSSLSKMGRD